MLVVSLETTNWSPVVEKRAEARQRAVVNENDDADVADEQVVVVVGAEVAV